KTTVYSALHEVAFESSGTGRGPQTDVDPPVPSIVIAGCANTAHVSFSKRGIVHEFMIMDRPQPALIIDVPFTVPKVGINCRLCRSDILFFLFPERFFQSGIPGQRSVFEPARIKLGRGEKRPRLPGMFP